jgi:hypothetical protein
VRTLIKVAKILAFTALLLIVSLIGGVVTIVWSQAAAFRFASNCAAVTGVGAGSFCVQWGTSSLAPSFWWYNGTAWAQNFGSDTAGTQITLDSTNEIASVAMAGQHSAVLFIGANQTIAGATQLVPVRSPDGTNFYEDNVYFNLGQANTQLQAYPLGDPTQPVSLSIWTPIASTHLGVKMKVYGGSGNVVARVRATSMHPVIALLGSLGLLQETDLGGGTRGLNVTVANVLAQYNYTRSATLTFDSNGDEVAISGGGGQVCAEIRSGATMTVQFEAHVGDGSYLASDFLVDGATTAITSTSSFPVRGCFLNSAWTDYKLRVSAHSAGSAAAWIIVSAGAGMPRLNVGLNTGSNLIGFAAPGASAATTSSWLPCYQVTTASTNAKSCKQSAGNLHGFLIVNPTATVPFLRLYNTANNPPTCSSATGFVGSMAIPASTSGAGFTAFHGSEGFLTGIEWCVTGGSSSTDNTNGPAGITIKALYR